MTKYDLYKKHYKTIQSYARHFAKIHYLDQDDLMSIFSEKIVKGHIEILSDPENRSKLFLGWCRRTMHNLSIDQVRKLSNRQVQISSLTNEDGELNDIFENLRFSQLNGENLFISKQTFRNALEVIDREFDAKYALLLLLRITGYTYEEMAEVVGLPLGTVKSYLHLSRKKLLTYITQPKILAKIAS